MTYTEVKELLAAGFTHDEIMTIINPQNPQDINNLNIKPVEQEKYSEKAAAPDADSDPTQEDRKEAAPENTNIPEGVSVEKVNQLNETINKLIKTIQVTNLQNNSFGSNKETDLNSEVDNIMASIIRPEHEKGGSSK